MQELARGKEDVLNAVEELRKQGEELRKHVVTEQEQSELENSPLREQLDRLVCLKVAIFGDTDVGKSCICLNLTV